MSVMEDGRPNLTVIDEAFGHHSDLYTDVMQVQPNAGPEQIQEAYFDRRDELFKLLADIDFAHDDDAAEGNGTNGPMESITDSHRRDAERKMDAVVCAVRILGDADLRLQYDDLRSERIHDGGAGGGNISPNRSLGKQADMGLGRQAHLAGRGRRGQSIRDQIVQNNNSSLRGRMAHRLDSRRQAQPPSPSVPIEPQSSHSSIASDASRFTVPALMNSSTSNTDASFLEKRTMAPPSPPKPKHTSKAMSIRERLGVGATIRTRSGIELEEDQVVRKPMTTTSRSPATSPTMSRNTRPQQAVQPPALTQPPPLSPPSRGRTATPNATTTTSNAAAVANGKPKRRPSRTRSMDGDASATISAGSTTYVSDDDDDDEEYTFYTVDDASVTESVLIASPKAPTGILDRIRNEILGALDDTTRSFEQVMNVFTLQEEDIVAVMGRIDKAKLQMSQTHILYPHKGKSKETSKSAKPTSTTSGRKSPAKAPPLRKALQ
jgi:hypothetical protein